MAETLKWTLNVEFLMACNCDWGCPCGFQAPPTYGTCEGALAYRIVEGQYGDESLNGLGWALGAAWPGPLHELKGRGIVYLDSRAEGTKREALEAIATGKAGGPIGIFMSTITNGLEVLTAPLEFNFDGKNSHFRVGDAIEVAFDPILNPVTGDEHQVSILLPDGMLAKREDHFSSKTFDVNAPGLSFSYTGHAAIAMQNIWHGP